MHTSAQPSGSSSERPVMASIRCSRLRTVLRWQKRRSAATRRRTAGVSPRAQRFQYCAAFAPIDVQQRAEHCTRGPRRDLRIRDHDRRQRAVVEARHADLARIERGARHVGQAGVLRSVAQIAEVRAETNSALRTAHQNFGEPLRRRVARHRRARRCRTGAHSGAATPTGWPTSAAAPRCRRARRRPLRKRRRPPRRTGRAHGTSRTRATSAVSGSDSRPPSNSASSSAARACCEQRKRSRTVSSNEAADDFRIAVGQCEEHVRRVQDLLVVGGVDRVFRCVSTRPRAPRSPRRPAGTRGAAPPSAHPDRRAGAPTAGEDRSRALPARRAPARAGATGRRSSAASRRAAVRARRSSSDPRP